MKKVMFGLAAAAAISAFAIESANIVGYQDVPRYSTYTFAGSMFADVGQSYYTLNNVKISSIMDDGTDFIQFFKPGTTVLDKDQSYYFDGDVWCYKFDASSSEVGDWEEDDEVPANTCTIRPGEGFLIRFTSGKSANAKIVFPSPVAANE